MKPETTEFEQAGHTIQGDLECEATIADGEDAIGTMTVANATLAAANGLTYSPNANYSGSDSFTFKANDGTVDSNTATVSITVLVALRDRWVTTG